MIQPFRFLTLRGRVLTRRRVIRRRLVGAVTLALILVAAAIAQSTGAFAQSTAAAILKSQIIVDGDYITLDDLFMPQAFDGPSEAGHIVIAAAPSPGESLTLDAGRVRQLAAEHGLAWANAGRIDHIDVTRSSRLIGARDVEDTLLGAFAARGIAPKVSGAILKVRFSGPSPTLRVAKDDAATIAVDSLQFDERTGQFRASVRAPADDLNGSPTILIGRAYEAVRIPVTVRDIAEGERITAQDFAFDEVDVDRVGQNVLTRVSDLVGLTPRRGLRAGQTLHQGDVVTPVVIAKNELVQMVVRTGGMSLSAQGRALDAGGLHETVRVMNTTSKRMLQATVTGPGEVTVQIGSAPQTLARADAAP